ncbi:hypothetical protein SCB49_01859 [unidentified eubacterium SCB49]|nr:hypothetical protein SCB49_01859 [unidentified eubacterium SCB49]
MKFWPKKEYHFTLIDTQEKTLERLKRRTEHSKHLTSSHTDKSFRGIINHHQFKLITSEIGFGAFCVLEGTIEPNGVKITITIHKVFKGFLLLFMLFPVAAVCIQLLTATAAFHWLMIVIMLGQIAVIRFILIPLFFKRLSKRSLQSLRDVLDIQLIKK